MDMPAHFAPQPTLVPQLQASPQNAAAAAAAAAVAAVVGGGPAPSAGLSNPASPQVLRKTFVPGSVHPGHHVSGKIPGAVGPMPPANSSQLAMKQQAPIPISRSLNSDSFIGNSVDNIDRRDAGLVGRFQMGRESEVMGHVIGGDYDAKLFYRDDGSAGQNLHGSVAGDLFLHGAAPSKGFPMPGYNHNPNYFGHNVISASVPSSPLAAPIPIPSGYIDMQYRKSAEGIHFGSTGANPSQPASATTASHSVQGPGVTNQPVIGQPTQAAQPTQSASSASHSRPASRRNSRDLSDIWKMIQDFENVDIKDSNGKPVGLDPSVPAFDAESHPLHPGDLDESDPYGIYRNSGLIGRGGVVVGTSGMNPSVIHHIGNATYPPAGLVNPPFPTSAPPAGTNQPPPFPERFILDEDEETPMSTTFARRYLQMHTETDKFPVLIRRDSYPGMLSASSAALEFSMDFERAYFDSFKPQQQQQQQPQQAQQPQRGVPPVGHAPFYDMDRNPRGMPPRDGMDVNFARPSNANPHGDSNENVRQFHMEQEQKLPPMPAGPRPGRMMGRKHPTFSGALNTNGPIGTGHHGGYQNPSPNPMGPHSGNSPTPYNRPGSPIGAYGSQPGVPITEPHLPANIPGTNICRFFQQGFCSRGEHCPYAHVTLGAPVRNMNNVGGNGAPNGVGGMSGGAGPTHGPRGFYGPGPMNNNQGPTGIQQQQQQQQQQHHHHHSHPHHHHPPHAPVMPGYPNVRGEFGNASNPALMHPAARGAPPNTNQSANNPAANNHNQNAARESAKNHKRSMSDEGSRFATASLEQLVGEIYSLCKDQHGCRYLQKKLEEGVENYVTMIFTEVFEHFVELMTDPFGNYLCQKLLEHCSDAQRARIVENVSKELVNISLNMHGTRAVQKMIEYVSGADQIGVVVEALNSSVVTLIKDLNGNHVIQKCLNRLSAKDNQFIYDAVTKNCIEVATHRHGCCVLQRCIDHASDAQRLQLVTEITFHALRLVQDPFGNYVVQYVLDLQNPVFSDSLIKRFIGHVCELSIQKFSSNVIEKCIRVSELDTRRQLIEELLNKERLEKLLRDLYANYVVQTGLDYAEPLQRIKLVDCIRPLIPAIRNTPYGKRIQGKIFRDAQLTEVQV